MNQMRNAMLRKNPMKPDQDIPLSSSIVPIHLLLVEDNPGDARLVYEMLRNQLHIKLEVADCLAACMLRLDRGGIDLVLLDLGLGDSQGLNTLTSVAHTHPAMPVVALTGLDDDALALRTVQAGGQDYLTKNTVTPEILRRTIRHAFERKRVESQIKTALEALKRSEENFRCSLEDSPLGVRVATVKGESIYANKVLLGIYGYANVDELNKIPLKERYTPQSYAEFRVRKKAREQGNFGPSEYEINIVRKNGEIRHLQVFRKEVLWNGTNQFQVIYQDITERKLAEEKVKSSLAEKEILLKEVHHRVKNNLMIIIGLIKMQEAKADNEMFNPLLQELEGRIRAMALVHEGLYKSKDLAHVNLQSYIETMSGQIHAQFGADRDIRFSLQAAGVEVNLDIAVPCGLILNELVTNAYKHAFPAGRPGSGAGKCEINVIVKQEGGMNVLTVADNGVGLPADLDWEKSETLGLRLIKMLSQQINGAVDLDRASGTTFRLHFAHQPKRN